MYRRQRWTISNARSLYDYWFSPLLFYSEDYFSLLEFCFALEREYILYYYGENEERTEK